MDPLVFPQAINGPDVRMVERGQDAGFAVEARQAFRVAREGFRQDFQGHVAVELGVVSAIDFAHSAHAERHEQPPLESWVVNKQR